MIHTVQQFASQSYTTREKASHGQNTTPVQGHKASPQKDSASRTFPPTTSATSFSPSASMSFRYYQPPKQVAESDSDDYDSDEGGRSYGRRRQESVSDYSGSKRTGACTHCKALKVKCHFTPGQAACNRCQLSKLDCVVFGRKKRRAVPTHEELLRKSRKQDMEISALLQRIDAMSTERNISEWVSRSQPNSNNPSEASSKSSDVGREASPPSTKRRSGLHHFEDYPRCLLSREELYGYFPDEIFDEKAKVPTIVSCGLVTPQEVYRLFDLYFNVVNPYFSILDRHLHTPARLFWKSHFLFTIICSVASRFYEERPNLQTSLFEFAKDCCGKALVGDEKTVDNCQAFLLTAVYQLPRRRYEHQRGWLYMGVAFRLALELKLNEPCDDTVSERERLNRTRTWLNCYCVDASHATQFGKPAMISVDDYVARQSRDWYRSSRLNLAIDIHLVAYVEVLQTMGRFKKETSSSPTNSRKPDADTYLDISRRYNERLERLRDEWTKRFEEQPVSADDKFICDYRADLHRMINAYSRLVVLAFGFQKAAAVKSGAPRQGFHENIRLCIATAHEVISRMTQRLAPSGFLKYGMEAHFLFVSFAAAFLINLLKPKFAFLINEEERRIIPTRVRELILVLRSKKVASEIGHAPNSPFLYARFLHAHLDRTILPKEISAVASPMSAHVSATAQTDGNSGSWAFADAGHAFYPNYSNNGYQDRGTMESAYAQFAGTQMDFSLNNFLQTISAQPQLQQPSPPPGSDTSYWSEILFLNNQSLSSSFAWPMVVDETSSAQQPQQYNTEYA